MRRAIGISLALIILLSGLYLVAQTPSATPYTTPDTGVTWYMDDLVLNSGGTVIGGGGTYVITDHVYISPRDTIIIQPGEIIKFDSGVNLTVNGTLIADGNGANMITFTSNASSPGAGDWGCIIFEDTSSDANCIINYSTIEFSNYGILCEHASPTITNNTITMNALFGMVLNASSPLIENNTISSNLYGIVCGYPSKPVIRNNQILDNFISGIFSTDSNAEIDGNTISGGMSAIFCAFGSPDIKNNTLSSMAPYSILAVNVTDINVTDNTFIDSQMIIYNSSINKMLLVDSVATTVNCTYPIPTLDIDSNSILIVQNYLHVKVIDSGSAPMQGAWVNVTDNGDQIYSRQTDADGYCLWFEVTDRVYYYGNSPTENITGITVENGTMSFTCLTSADPSDIDMFLSHVEIFQGSPDYGINLVFGWNLISIPFIQSDTNINSVLSTISGDYDAVQWYNASDTADQWKHNRPGKPSQLNDLNDIDHTMGFWIHITDINGVLFLYPGTEPVVNQNINLRSGWNLVGYPSVTSYNRTDGLNTLKFDFEVNMILYYNAGLQKWTKMGETDNFQHGKGYYIHATTDCVWNIPL
ncbi:MAG: right-handed parallel beta-helix repeat-containing protein [Thermoplasmata archaeon]|nr:MAG: right-handed parallel beta-helix repeat-containing protein [Thermoplasmata archaeon]